MYPYSLVIRNKGNSIALVIRGEGGEEAAYNRFRMACLALAPECLVDLRDGITGELLASSSEDWDQRDACAPLSIQRRAINLLIALAAVGIAGVFFFVWYLKEMREQEKIKIGIDK